MDNLVKLAAIFGFTLACISLGWQIWTFFANRKEDIKGTLSITVATFPGGKNVPAFELKIWNNGQVPVYIKSIFLNCGEESNRLGAFVSSFQFKGNPPRTDPIQPGEGRSYILPVIPPALAMFSKAIGQPEDKVWVSVTSHKSEVLRILGREVKFLLTPILESQEKNSKSKPSSFESSQT